MSTNPSERPEGLPEQPEEAQDLAAQLASKRQQIAALQQELAQLEKRQRQMKRAQTVQRPGLPSAPEVVPHEADASGLSSISSSSKRLEYSLLALLVLAAFLIRMYRLGSFPDTVLADEADNAQDSIRILYGSPPLNGFFGLDWTSQPAFSAYKEAAFIAAFGFHIFAMRLSSAVFSTLALIPFYLLLRRQFSIVASALATILLATNVWYLNFSRSGWNCIDVCFYMLMAMLFLLWGCDTVTSATPGWKKWAPFALAGFFCALGLYGYPPGRAITLAVIAFFPIIWLSHRSHAKTFLLGYLLLFATEAIVFAPQAVYVAKHWEQFNGRSKVVLIFNDPVFRAHPMATMWKQLDHNIRGPWDGRVNNTAQYSPVGEPQLDKITGGLALAGMALALFLKRLRTKPETWLWWLMLLTGWGLTQLLTVGTPNGARGIGYMPTLVYFAGAGIEELVLLLQHIPATTDIFLILRQFSLAILVAVILVAGYFNVRHYVDWQNMPQTRKDRDLYVTTREFPEWSAMIVDLARNKANITNVEQWRDAHPIQDVANPYGNSNNEALNP